MKFRLLACPKESLFPATKGGKMSGMAMTVLLRRMKVDVTVHGFRSGFRDWSAECTGYAHEVADNGFGAHYREQG